MTELGPNRYGKQSIRLVRVVRGPVHRVRDLTVDVSLEGGFGAAFTDGDNSSVVATDTMKNTVYALAPEHLTGAIEGFGIALAGHFLEAGPVERATITIREHAWEPLETGTGPAPDAFRRTGGATRTAVDHGRCGRHHRGQRDRGPGDHEDHPVRVLRVPARPLHDAGRGPGPHHGHPGHRVLAQRRYATADWDARHATLVRTLLATFADHHSESVQHSIWVIGTAMLDAEPGIDEVTMAMPNLHHWLVDLSPFGGTNEGEIFVATAQPHGQIEATVRRSAGP